MIFYAILLPQCFTDINYVTVGVIAVNCMVSGGVYPMYRREGNLGESINCRILLLEGGSLFCCSIFEVCQLSAWFISFCRYLDLVLTLLLLILFAEL